MAFRLPSLMSAHRTVRTSLQGKGPVTVEQCQGDRLKNRPRMAFRLPSSMSAHRTFGLVYRGEQVWFSLQGEQVWFSYFGIVSGSPAEEEAQNGLLVVLLVVCTQDRLV